MGRRARAVRDGLKDTPHLGECCREGAALGIQSVVGCCQTKEMHQLPLMDLLYSPLFQGARNDARFHELRRRQRDLQAAASERRSQGASPASAE